MTPRPVVRESAGRNVPHELAVALDAVAASIFAAMKMGEKHFDMTSRVALFTGAGRGIGLEMARTLAMAGCAVAIQDIEVDVAQVEARKINDAGGRAAAFGGDVGDLSLPKTLVENVVQQFGGLHVLVNNAAIQEYRHWLTCTPEDIEKQLRADLVAPILFCQQVVPIFKQQRWGRIVNLGSIQQRNGNPNMLPYSLSKAAMHKLTMALARDLAKDQITVNLIAPGWIDTHRTHHTFVTPGEKERLGKQAIPLGRIGEPGDFAGVILLLCSDAGAFITGQSIHVDGGMSA